MILQAETQKFKTQNIKYFEDPSLEIIGSFKVWQLPEWKNNWDKFINAMVFEAIPPTYEDAVSSFLQLSKKLLTKTRCNKGKA